MKKENNFKVVDSQPKQIRKEKPCPAFKMYVRNQPHKHSNNFLLIKHKYKISKKTDSIKKLGTLHQKFNFATAKMLKRRPLSIKPIFR